MKYYAPLLVILSLSLVGCIPTQTRRVSKQPLTTQSQLRRQLASADPWQRALALEHVKTFPFLSKGLLALALGQLCAERPWLRALAGQWAKHYPRQSRPILEGLLSSPQPRCRRNALRHWRPHRRQRSIHPALLRALQQHGEERSLALIALLRNAPQSTSFAKRLQTIARAPHSLSLQSLDALVTYAYEQQQTDIAEALITSANDRQFRHIQTQVSLRGEAIQKWYTYLYARLFDRKRTSKRLLRAKSKRVRLRTLRLIAALPPIYIQSLLMQGGWRHLLRDPSARIRDEFIYLLRRQTNIPLPRVQLKTLIEQCVRDTSSTVRKQLMYLIQYLPLQETEKLSYLQKGLLDKNMRVQRAALFTWSKLDNQPHTKKIIRSIPQTLQTGSWSSKALALYHISWRQSTLHKQLPWVLALTGHQRWQIRALVAYVLRRLERTKSVINVFETLLQDPHPQVLIQSLRSLIYIGPDASRFAKQLQQLQRHRSPKVRRLATMALRWPVYFKRLPSSVLFSETAPKDRAVRMTTLSFLHTFMHHPDFARQAFQQFATEINRDDSGLRYAALRALRRWHKQSSKEQTAQQKALIQSLAPSLYSMVQIMLTQPQSEQLLASALLLSHLGTLAQSLIPSIEKALPASHPAIRRQLYKALYTLQPSAKKRTQWLRSLLVKKGKDGLLGLALFAKEHHKMPSLIPLIAPHIVDVTDQKRPIIQKHLVQIFKRQQTISAPLLSQFLMMLYDRRWRATVTELLTHVTFPKRAAMPILMSALRVQEPSIRQEGLKMLGRAGPSTLPTLRAFLRSSKSGISRISAIYTLMQWGPRSLPALPECMMLLREGSPRLQRIAAEAIGRMGAKALDAISLLTKALGSPYPAIRAEAARALGSFPKYSKALSQRLLPLLDDKDPSVREYTADSLGLLRPMNRESIRALFSVARHDLYPVRIAALQALVQIGRPKRMILRFIRMFRRDADIRIRRQVPSLIAQLKST